MVDSFDLDTKEPIGVGVVGCGYWGPNLVRNFKSLPNCNLKAMCDVSEARLKHIRNLYPDVEGITDFGHMLNGVGVDAVVVPAPVKHHYSLAKASLLAGKHTLIEKPMASSSKKPIVVGVVGCGYWGPTLVRNLKGLPNCNLKAMCDLSEERLKHMRNLYPDIEGVTDFEHLLNGVGLDAVVVAAPVKHHYSLAKASLLAGKHTLIEKPMASSSAQCEDLIEIAERNGLVLMVGHTFLYSAPERKIVEIVQAGDIGEIRYINSRRQNLGLFQKDINVAWDLAPHDISIILHILEEFPQAVNCQGNAHVTPGIEDVTNISLLFRNKRFATIQSSWLEPRKIREMTIVGTRRMIVCDDLQTHEKIRIYDTRVDRPPHHDTFADFHYSYHYGDSYIPYLKQKEPLKAECQHFLECIEKGAKPLTSGREGLELVTILEAASKSLKIQGAPVIFSESRKMPSILERPGVGEVLCEEPVCV